MIDVNEDDFDSSAFSKLTTSCATNNLNSGYPLKPNFLQNLNIVVSPTDASSASSVTERYIISLKLANIYLKSGEILKGYKLIARAYKANPLAVEHSDIANILPYALEMTKLAKQAKKNSDKILWNRVADNFFDMGVYSEPISAYKKSLLIDPNQSEIRLKLALSYKKNNQINRAIEQLEVLLEQNEKDFYANYYLGKMLRYSLNDKENAVLHLKQAKEILSSSKDNFSDMQYPTFMNDINAELGK